MHHRQGFNNLYAMEIDPTVNLTELELNCLGENEQAEAANFRKLIGELLNNFPGMDEYTSYTEVFRLVDSMDYSVVVFDTAPTGHTLRLLAFPEMMEKSLGKVLSLKNQVRIIFLIFGAEREFTAILEGWLSSFPANIN